MVQGVQKRKIMQKIHRMQKMQGLKKKNAKNTTTA